MACTSTSPFSVLRLAVLPDEVCATIQSSFVNLMTGCSPKSLFLQSAFAVGQNTASLATRDLLYFIQNLYSN